ncbi:putative PurR-regulated permease PerM [Thiogranum longum]|uniref:Putative PurR-regulated permease PerM n=1 Tax=Thiogranum longum TaxID=1537524 RepID=A0A4R1HCN3_9GAMM|nr:AI-2E family transporter [Thiogranum longum]TCK17970.1 putative PurR-regulated permease PerM [Thiogranum longum]
MSDINSQPTALRFVLGLAALVVIVAGMKTAQSIIVPFLLAAFISIISAPYLNWLNRKGMPMPLALLVIILVIVAAGVALAALLGTSLDAFSEALPSYQERLQDKVVELAQWLAAQGIDVSDRTFLSFFNPGSAMALVSGLLKGLGNVLTNAFLILLTVIFILMEASSFPVKLRTALRSPEHSLTESYTVLDNIKSYMSIKLLTSALTGFLVSVGLSVMGVDFAMLWGFFAFLLNFIPNIGSIIAAIPAVLLALLQFGAGGALGVAGLFLVVNIVIGSILEPRWMGNQLGLSPLIVFVSLVFWGWVFGPVGMFLSVPLTISVQIALASRDDTRWIAVLLGPGMTE